MDDLKRFERKLDNISENISEINITLAAQHVSLAEHIRRTQLLEEAVKPLEKHVAMVNGVMKFIGIIAILIGIVEAFMSVIKR